MSPKFAKLGKRIAVGFYESKDGNKPTTATTSRTSSPPNLGLGFQTKQALLTITRPFHRHPRLMEIRKLCKFPKKEKKKQQIGESNRQDKPMSI